MNSSYFKAQEKKGGGGTKYRKKNHYSLKITLKCLIEKSWKVDENSNELFEELKTQNSKKNN